MGRRSGFPHRRDELETLSLDQLDAQIAESKLQPRFINDDKRKKAAMRRLNAIQKIRELKTQAPE